MRGEATSALDCGCGSRSYGASGLTRTRGCCGSNMEPGAQVVSHATGHTEAAWIVSKLQELQRDGQTGMDRLEWSDMAVLYRTHAMSKHIEDALVLPRPPPVRGCRASACSDRPKIRWLEAWLLFPPHSHARCSPVWPSSIVASAMAAAASGRWCTGKGEHSLQTGWGSCFLGPCRGVPLTPGSCAHLLSSSFGQTLDTCAMPPIAVAERL